MRKEDLIKFWVNSSDMDFKTMQNMFKSKDYHWSLFIGHLVIEKLLKALFVKANGVNVAVPKIHDLLSLANRANLVLTEEQQDILDEITSFNINARYQDYKLSFYKRCTPKYSNEQKKKIEEIRLWLKKQI
ncbi:HEPN domain-containing protein [Candidatus Ruminimicrobium bovinum]|uniref:HEPN domain-containing protein n=1 Tax=Candidatus Ruminimicrobium bovinum TaxID=3242779 RepID=UPI0039B998DE